MLIIFTKMLKINEEINDLNDVSLVNPEEERQSKLVLICKILCDSAQHVLSSLLICLGDNASLIFLGMDKQNDISKQFISFQFGISLAYLIALTFITGIMHVLESTGKLKKLYFESIALSLLFVLLVFIPITLCSYFVAPLSSWVSFVVYLPSYMMLKFIMLINLKVLMLKKNQLVVNSFCLLLFAFHIILCYCLCIGYELGVSGLAISLNISYLLGSLVSLLIVKSSTRIFEVKNEDLEVEHTLLVAFVINLNTALYDLFHRKHNQHRNSKEFDQTHNNFHISNIDKIKINANNNAHITEQCSLEYKELASNKQPLLGTTAHSFTLKLTLNLFWLVFKLSLLSSLNYVGFTIFIFYSIFADNSEIAAVNIIIFNILIIPYLICYSFSNTHTNYISLESFSHSHANKYRFSKICSFTLLALSILISFAINYTSSFISLYYIKTEAVREQTQAVLQLYSYFLFPHFLSIMLDGYVLNSSKKIYVSYILAFIFAFNIVPAAVVLHAWFNYSFIVYWYGFFGYILLHVVTLFIYLAVSS